MGGEQDLNPFVPTSLLVNLLRAAMFDSPRALAEACSGMPIVAASASKEQAVVRFERAGTLDSFVIFDRGTRYTTRELPDWAQESDVTVAEITSEWSDFMQRAELLVSGLKELDVPIAEHLGADDKVSNLRLYLESEFANEAILFRTLSQVRGFNTQRLIASEREALRWASACADQLMFKYRELRVAGSTVAPALATFILFMNARVPANQLYAAGIQPSGRIAEDSGSICLPVMDPCYYASHFAVHTRSADVSNSLIQTSVRCARESEQTADRFVQAGRKKVTFTEFYSHIYSAGIYYRIAQFFFLRILELYKAASSQPEVLVREEVLCEEQLAHIGASLNHASMLLDGSVALNYMPHWKEWLAELGTQDERAAEATIQDFRLRLLIPDFARDLAVESLRLRDPRRYRRATRRLSRIGEELERQIVRAVGDPNLLTWAHGRIADAAREMKDLETERLHRPKADPAYATRLLGEAMASIAKV